MFPDVSHADEDGLLAIGGDVDPATLELAYRSGIFPWYSGHIPMWYSPDPRFVLFPGELKISKSMRQVLNGNKFEFTVNKCFRQVMQNCGKVKRKGQWGTWINEDLINSFVELHSRGLAHSAEAWQNGELVGGLYGVKIGRAFCGESMFSTASNASKFAFINFTRVLEHEGIELIDCQVYTEHLESLGARMIPRSLYLQYLT